MSRALESRTRIHQSQARCEGWAGSQRAEGAVRSRTLDNSAARHDDRQGQETNDSCHSRSVAFSRSGAHFGTCTYAPRPPVAFATCSRVASSHAVSHGDWAAGCRACRRTRSTPGRPFTAALPSLGPVSPAPVDFGPGRSNETSTVRGHSQRRGRNRRDRRPHRRPLLCAEDPARLDHRR